MILSNNTRPTVSSTDAGKGVNLRQVGQASITPIPNRAELFVENRRVKSGSGGFEVGVGSIKPGLPGSKGLTLDVPDNVSEGSARRTTSSTGAGRLTPLKSPAVMPTYTQVSSSPSVAAGVPVLELIRKFEEEKILNRDDRLMLNEALYNPERREAVVKALQAIELSTNSRFAIRRLKALIHQNGIGEVSSKAINQYKAEGKAVHGEFPVPLPASTDDSLFAEGQNLAGAERSSTENSPLKHSKNEDREKGSAKKPSPSQRMGAGVILAQLNTQTAIQQVISETPMYVNPENFNVCSKIAKRLRDFLVKHKPSAMGIRKFAVLIGTGSFNPLTRMHLRSYFVAKQYLESKAGFIVLGSLLSPAHSMTVRERYRTNQKEILPSPHRLAVAQLLVKDSKWLSIDPWEITRRRPMDYLSLLEHTHKMLGEHFPSIEFKVLYLAKANAVPLIAPAHLRAFPGDVGVVSVCRAMEYDSIQASLSAKWNGLIWCVEDTAVLDATMDVVTSRKVREQIRAGGNIAPLVGDAIDLYVRTHRLGPKMSGQEEWGDEEKLLPVAASRQPPRMAPGDKFGTASIVSRGDAEQGMDTRLSTDTETSNSFDVNAQFCRNESGNIVINDDGVVASRALDSITEFEAGVDDDDESVGGSVGGYGDINDAAAGSAETRAPRNNNQIQQNDSSIVTSTISVVKSSL